MKVSVLGTEEKDAVYFLLEISSPEKTWIIRRRFSEFVELREALISSFGAAPDLPPRFPFASFFKIVNETRAAKIQIFLE